MSDANCMSGAIASELEKIAQNRPNEIAAGNVRGINTRQGFQSFPVNLTDADLATGTGRLITTRGFGIAIPSGNFFGTNVAMFIDFGAGGASIPVTPGIVIKAPFDYFYFRVVPRGGAITGTCSLIVSREPDVWIDEGISSSAISGGAGNFNSASTVNTITGTATGTDAAGNIQSVSSLANIPAGASGVAIPVGARGAFALINGQSANVLSGTLVWWRYCATNTAWVETTVQETHSVGRPYVMGSEQQLTCYQPGDRLYAEWRQGTLAAGTQAYVTVFINN